MGQFFDDIPPFLPPWLAEQEMFWVATAPLGGGGHVNVSPKGTRGCFHYVSPTRVWYQDLSGSGACFYLVYIILLRLLFPWLFWLSLSPSYLLRLRPITLATRTGTKTTTSCLSK